MDKMYVPIYSLLYVTNWNIALALQNLDFFLNSKYIKLYWNSSLKWSISA